MTNQISELATFIVGVASLPKERFDSDAQQFRSVVGGTFSVLRSNGRKTEDAIIAERRFGLDLADPKVRAAVVLASGGKLTISGSGFMLASKVRANKMKARAASQRTKISQREARFALAEAIAEETAGTAETAE